MGAFELLTIIVLLSPLKFNRQASVPAVMVVLKNLMPSGPMVALAPLLASAASAGSC